MKKTVSIFVTLSLLMALVPVKFEANEISRNNAHAIAPVVAGMAFLEAAASGAGVTTSQFVASIVGMSTFATGISFAKSTGVSLGASLGSNLNSLVDAADYPNWDDLSSSDKTAWGTKENYDAAKFNSLLDAFDLGDARQRFYSSGGGNFEWQNDEREKVEQLGRIAKNWVLGGYNTAEDILTPLVSSYADVYANFLGRTAYEKVNANDYVEWPTAVEKTDLYINYGDVSQFVFNDGDVNYRYSIVTSLPGVYWIITHTDNSNNSGFLLWMFSKQSFKYGTKNQTIVEGNPAPTNPTPVSNSSVATINSETFYWNRASVNVQSSIPDLVYENMHDSGYVYGLDDYYLPDNVKKVLYLILFEGEELDINPAQVNVLDYPEDIESDPDLEVYYPENGVFPGMNFTSFTTDGTGSGSGGETGGNAQDYSPFFRRIIELLEQFSFYATGHLKVHDEGVFNSLTEATNELVSIGNKLSEMLVLLRNWMTTSAADDLIGEVDFDEIGDNAADLLDTISSLAPFGALLLISEMTAILSQTGNIEKPELVFPFEFMPGEEYTLIIDLSWLDDLKPVINTCCIIILLYGLAGATMRIVEMEAAS